MIWIYSSIQFSTSASPTSEWVETTEQRSCLLNLIEGRSEGLVKLVVASPLEMCVVYMGLEVP